MNAVPMTPVELLEVRQRLRAVVRRYVRMIAALAATCLACTAVGIDSLRQWLAEGGDLSLLAACMTGASAAVCSWRAGRELREALGIRRALASLQAVIDGIEHKAPTR
jgi:hypothetical protein